MSTLRYNGPVAYGTLEEMEEIELQDGYISEDSFIYQNENGKFQIIKVEKVGMFEDTSDRRGEEYPAAMIRDRYGNSKTLKIDKSLFVDRENCQESIKKWNFEQTRPRSTICVEIVDEDLTRFHRAMFTANQSDRTTAILEAMELYIKKYAKDEK